jgi:hypothetical protein
MKKGGLVSIAQGRLWGHLQTLSKSVGVIVL